MKEATEKLLEKSARAIETARRTLAIPDTEAAIARAYYAMFYAAEALLFERGLTFRKHSVFMLPSVSASLSLAL
ncbi:HEPN domain-containing protein [Candidatus Methylomirabilis sp.]|uniref:HEPN domain-containing protein n=1 Tax=Candidatus Methylomirabilis sp. TaxID=2032687 RepID=UPI00307679FE